MEWISIFDRKPEPMQNVLVAHYGVDEIVDIEWMYKDGSFPFECLYGPVTHWLPLPENPNNLED